MFSGRDLARIEKGKPFVPIPPVSAADCPFLGTWLGVSKNGRLAVLTNFHESSSELAIGEKSRGAMITSFLTCPDPAGTPTKVWLRKVLETGELKGVGGFSMICGTLRPGEGNLEALAVISNRTDARDDGVEATAHWIGTTKGETHGLSNSLFDDPWPKVEIGKKLLDEMISDATKSEIPEEELIEKCFSILGHDTLPVFQVDDTYETEINALRDSVFIPAFDAAEHVRTPDHPDRGSEEPEQNGNHKKPAAKDIAPETFLDSLETLGATNGLSHAADKGPACGSPLPPLMTEKEQARRRGSPRLYGTTQQTVILVNKQGHLKYVEKTLYDSEAQPIEAKDREVRTEFDIENWPSPAARATE